MAMVSGFGEQRNRKPLFQMLDRNALRLGKAEYSEYSWLWWSSYPAPGDVVCAGVLVAYLFIPPLARLPVAGELLATQDFLADSGGCAANTATTLAKLGVR